MNVLIIGASGLVGSDMARRLETAGHDVTGTHYTNPTAETSLQLDKTDEEQVSRIVTSENPDIVVDTAAFHDVDQCESDRSRAWAVNVIGTQYAAEAAEAVDAHFIYLSTDYVFPGNPDHAPYAESDPIGPVNYYGQCKYAGEQAAKLASQWTVLRSSVLYGRKRPNFVTWVLNNIEDGTTMDITTDQVGTPTYVSDISEAAVLILANGIEGVLHAGGPESLSRYEFTSKLLDAYGHSTKHINRVTTEALGQRAKRPTDSSLDSTHLYNAIEYTFRSPQAAFECMID